MNKHITYNETIEKPKRTLRLFLSTILFIGFLVLLIMGAMIVGFSIEYERFEYQILALKIVTWAYVVLFGVCFLAFCFWKPKKSESTLASLSGITLFFVGAFVSLKSASVIRKFGHFDVQRDFWYFEFNTNLLVVAGFGLLLSIVGVYTLLSKGTVFKPNILARTSSIFCLSGFGIFSFLAIYYRQGEVYHGSAVFQIILFIAVLLSMVFQGYMVFKKHKFENYLEWILTTLVSCSGFVVAYTCFESIYSFDGYDYGLNPSFGLGFVILGAFGVLLVFSAPLFLFWKAWTAR